MSKYNNIIKVIFSHIMWLLKHPLAIISLLILIGIGIAYFNFYSTSKEETELSEEKIISPTDNVVTSFREIGEWEFYNIATEELVDTIRKRFLAKDELTLIYKGTLRFGINFKEVKEQWFYSPHKDTIYCKLPKVKLLDERFINETNIVVLHEDGKFTAKERAGITAKAYALMRKRNVTKANINKAEQVAVKEIKNYLQKFGFKYIEILWSDNK